MALTEPKVVTFDLIKVVPLPWDAGSNRSYEPVEKLAQELYEASMSIDKAGQWWPWMKGGNSEMQDKARFAARRKLRAEGHSPAVME